MFGTGQTFLTCARKEEANGNLTVYLRQVQIGFAQNVVLWTDHRLNNDEVTEKNEKLKNIIQEANHHIFYKKIEYIMKTSSKTTVSFMRSEFFRISLEISKTFRFVTNEERDNDKGFSYGQK